MKFRALSLQGGHLLQQPSRLLPRALYEKPDQDPCHHGKDGGASGQDQPCAALLLTIGVALKLEDAITEFTQEFSREIKL